MSQIEETNESELGEGAGYIATELAIGKTLEEALKLTDNDVIEGAGGIPARKAHCSLLAIRGLHEAIAHYREKQAEESKRLHQ
jgi:nitrogen fixation NifU-like protein